MNLNKILIYLLFFILPFGQLERFPGLPLYLHDLVIILLITLNIKFLNFSRPTLWFLASAGLSLILALFKLPFNQILFSSLYLFRWLAYACLLPIYQHLKLDLKPLLKYLCLVLAVFGIFQYLLVPDTRFLAGLNWDDHYYRLISTVFDPNYLGLIFVLGLILFNLQLLPSLILFTALLFTYSRSSYLALIIVGLYLAIIKKKFKIFIFALFAFIFALYFLPRPGGEGVKLERWFSVEQRLANYKESFQLIKLSPVFGLGFNTLRYYRNDFVSHAAAGLDSSLLFVFATTGIFGLIFYLNLVRNLWPTSALVKLSLMAILVHSLFQNSLFYPLIMIWLWSVVYF
ncbi:MAG: O-antigen ligase family protein [Patescibacteria group bacterium]|nr:O-antigen ligase family protein [Patescibacteria group bacterium]